MLGIVVIGLTVLGMVAILFIVDRIIPLKSSSRPQR